MLSTWMYNYKFTYFVKKETPNIACNNLGMEQRAIQGIWSPLVPSTKNENMGKMCNSYWDLTSRMFPNYFWTLEIKQLQFGPLYRKCGIVSRPISYSDGLAVNSGSIFCSFELRIDVLGCKNNSWFFIYFVETNFRVILWPLMQTFILIAGAHENRVQWYRVTKLSNKLIKR